MELEAPARRVVALYGAFNDILLDMGLGDRLAARTRADIRPELAALPVIGTHMRPNLELIAALQPDLILQFEGRREAEAQVAQLRALGFPVAVFRGSSFPDLYRIIAALGVLTGAEDRADALIDSLRSRLNALAERRIGALRPRVFFEIRSPNLLAAGANSTASAIIEAAGGENAVRVPERVARLNEEELIRLDPEVYIVQQGANKLRLCLCSGRLLAQSAEHFQCENALIGLGQTVGSPDLALPEPHHHASVGQHQGRKRTARVTGPYPAHQGRALRPLELVHVHQVAGNMMRVQEFFKPDAMTATTQCIHDGLPVRAGLHPQGIRLHPRHGRAGFAPGRSGPPSAPDESSPGQNGRRQHSDRNFHSALLTGSTFGGLSAADAFRMVFSSAPIPKRTEKMPVRVSLPRHAPGSRT